MRSRSMARSVPKAVPPPVALAMSKAPMPKAAQVSDMLSDSSAEDIMGKTETVDAPPQYEAPTGGASQNTSTALDFTQIPSALDKQFEALDTNGALRPTKIIVKDNWTLESRKGLLGKPSK